MCHSNKYLQEYESDLLQMCHSNKYLQKYELIQLQSQKRLKTASKQSRNSLETYNFQKTCFQKECIGNSSFQMCSQSTLDQFGQGKTLK